jgi:steroid 5-alpha reductase family enzyme
MNIFALSALIIAIYMLVMFLIAVIKRDNSIVDIAYGPAFLVVALILYLNQDVSQSQRSGLITLFVFLWALRLAFRILKKNFGKPEDFRYRAWRQEWSKKGNVYLLIRSFLQVFLLQGLIIYIVSMPIILSNTLQTDTLRWYNIFGACLWIFGFLFESIGDYQLDKFLKKKKAGLLKANIMKTGLWKYTRHPNYFGESMQWWGLALLCLMGVEYSLLAFVSPILITYLLLFVSGIPMLEKRWQGDIEWEDYAARTSAFVPRLPHKR